MEILQSDDKLREEIINDAKNKAERLLKKSNSEIKELEENSKKEIEKFEEETKKSFEKFVEEEKTKIFASIDIDFQKKSLKIIGETIESIFEEFKNNIVNDKDKYKSLMKNLILEAIKILNSKNYEIEINKRYAENIKDIFDNIKTKFKFNVYEKDKINGIIIYNSEKTKQIFISIDKFIEELKNREREKIYSMIFK